MFNNTYVKLMLHLIHMSDKLGIDPNTKYSPCLAFYRFIDKTHGLKLAEQTWYDAYQIFTEQFMDEVSNV